MATVHRERVMVGYDSVSAKLKQSDFAAAGALSGIITRGLCQPLDVLKIRFQLQVEPISHRHSSKYRSMAHAVQTIRLEEGAKAMWKGHVPAQWLSIVYGMGQFWCFEILSRKAHTLDLDFRYKPLVNFGCGAAAGSFATVVSFPFDVVRTRLVAQSEQFKVYTGVVQAIVLICKREGFLTLFRGMLPTMIQVAPHAGVQFMTYKMFDNIYRSLFVPNAERNTFTGTVVCGSLAGLCGKTSIYPLDLAKKRMQVQGFENRQFFGQNFVCQGFLDCMRRTFAKEGVKGLYKGLTPSLIKAITSSALHFSTYELACKIIASYR